MTWSCSEEGVRGSLASLRPEERYGTDDGGMLGSFPCSFIPPMGTGVGIEGIGDRCELGIHWNE